MTCFELHLSAQVENVEYFYPDPDNFYYQLKLQCVRCNEISPGHHIFSELDMKRPDGTRGLFNYTTKCKFCHRPANIGVMSSTSLLTYKNELSPQFQHVKSFDCRGADLVDINLDCDGWIAVTKAGKKFSVNFDGGDWTDYDEDQEGVVYIMELKYKIVKK